MDECEPLEGGVDIAHALSAIDVLDYTLFLVGRCRLTLSNPVLKAPVAIRLKLEYDDPLSNYALKFNLRRYILIPIITAIMIAIENETRQGLKAGGYTRPLLSSTRAVSDTQYTLNTP